jgi:hypothetical protein
MTRTCHPPRFRTADVGSLFGGCASVHATCFCRACTLSLGLESQVQRGLLFSLAGTLFGRMGSSDDVGRRGEGGRVPRPCPGCCQTHDPWRRLSVSTTSSSYELVPPGRSLGHGPNLYVLACVRACVRACVGGVGVLLFGPVSPAALVRTRRACRTCRKYR